MTYRSYADLGGQEVRGAIVREPEGELFHAPWEPRVMALVSWPWVRPGLSNIDMNRAARETLPDYKDLSYYEIWLAALEKLVLQKGVLGDHPPQPKRVLRAGQVAATIGQGSSYSRSPPHPARFAVGDRVRTGALHPAHHTRLPAGPCPRKIRCRRTSPWSTRISRHELPRTGRVPAVAVYRGLRCQGAVGTGA